MYLFIGGGLILAGVSALGVAYNNNGIILLKRWGQITRALAAKQAPAGLSEAAAGLASESTKAAGEPSASNPTEPGGIRIL